MDAHIERYLNRVKAMKSESTHDTYSSNLRQFNAWLDERGYEIESIDQGVMLKTVKTKTGKNLRSPT
jgi:site-specific recombinase XerD